MAAMSELIEWNRAADVLPDADTAVLVIETGEVDAWPGYLDGDVWRNADGFPLAAALFWAHMPEGPTGDEPSGNKPTKEYSAMLYALAQEIRDEEGCVTESAEALEDAAERMDTLTVTIRGLEIQRDELLAALIKYGLHKLSCDYVENHEGGIFGKSTGKCDCGFAEVIASVKGGAV